MSINWCTAILRKKKKKKVSTSRGRGGEISVRPVDLLRNLEDVSKVCVRNSLGGLSGGYPCHFGERVG